MPIISYGLDSRGLTDGVQKVRKGLNSISTMASSVGKTLGNMFSPLNIAVGGLASGFGALKLIQVGDEYKNMGAQLEYLTGSTASATDAQEALYKMSQRTMTSTTNNAKALSRFQLASSMTGLTIDENVEALGAINSLMRKTGVSSNEASAGMIQLGQALASGKLQGDEFRSISENVPALMDTLAKSLGVTRAELKEMSTQGELTSEILGKAFLDMASDPNLNELPVTVAGVWQKVENAFEKLWAKISTETGILDWISSGLEDLVTYVDENIPAIANYFLDMKDKIVEIWPEIQEKFMNGWNGIVSFFETSWPRIEAVFNTMFSWLKTIFGWIEKSIEGYKTFMELFNATSGELQAKTDLVAQNYYSKQQEQQNENGTGSYYDYDSKSYVTDDNEDSSKSAMNVYISQKQSREDIVNILAEKERQDTRSN